MQSNNTQLCHFKAVQMKYSSSTMRKTFFIKYLLFTINADCYINTAMKKKNEETTLFSSYFMLSFMSGATKSASSGILTQKETCNA